MRGVSAQPLGTPLALGHLPEPSGTVLTDHPDVGPARLRRQGRRVTVSRRTRLRDSAISAGCGGTRAGPLAQKAAASTSPKFAHSSRICSWSWSPSYPDLDEVGADAPVESEHLGDVGLQGRGVKRGDGLAIGSRVDVSHGLGCAVREVEGEQGAQAPGLFAIARRRRGHRAAAAPSAGSTGRERRS